jgi:hypothetical protein
MTGAEQARLDYQQVAPPGTYVDSASDLVLPQGARRASRARVAAAFILGVLVRSPYVSSDSALLFSIEVSILSRMENNPSWRCPPFCAGT